MLKCNYKRWQQKGGGKNLRTTPTNASSAVSKAGNIFCNGTLKCLIIIWGHNPLKSSPAQLVIKSTGSFYWGSHGRTPQWIMPFSSKNFHSCSSLELQRLLISTDFQVHNNDLGCTGRRYWRRLLAQFSSPSADFSLFVYTKKINLIGNRPVPSNYLQLFSQWLQVQHPIIFFSLCVNHKWMGGLINLIKTWLNNKEQVFSTLSPFQGLLLTGLFVFLTHGILHNATICFNRADKTARKHAQTGCLGGNPDVFPPEVSYWEAPLCKPRWGGWERWKSTIKLWVQLPFSSTKLVQENFSEKSTL